MGEPTTRSGPEPLNANEAECETAVGFPCQRLRKKVEPADALRAVTDLECVVSSWWLAAEAGAGEAAVKDVGAVLE
ncbi:hypothetical protein AB0H65_29445, partial [Streptomyces griseoaurantiacus]|uniref:hypothetical protein n=1 Tax=Streptomyces griseoaurantiacus TaxID=68213 RepID=UPI0034607732